MLIAMIASAEIKIEQSKALKLGGEPLSIVQSVSDGRLFVLLEEGEVLILAPNGQIQHKFNVDKEVKILQVSPDGQRLYLGKPKDKELLFIDLAAVYDLPVNNSAIKGPEDAPVTITVFDDFQCPYCARLVPVLEKVMQQYPTQVRIVFKHFPLSMHKFARQAAVASIAARNQGKFWQFHDELFANYNQLNEEKIRELAENTGLDMARFDQDIKNPAFLQEVNSDMQLGSKSGVRGTPAVFINGVQQRDRSINGFQQAIDAELK